MSSVTTAVPADSHTGINGIALTVLIVLFLLVTVMGFLATRWRRPTAWSRSTSGASAAARSAPG